MNVLALFEPIRVFVLDIDGVLTNGQLLLQEDGSMLRSMNIKDGYAIQLAMKQGYELLLLSGGRSEGARRRLERLGVEQVFIGVEDKARVLRKLMAEKGWNQEALLYMGDDMPDLEAMQLCGLRTAPADAIPEIRQVAQYLSPLAGGMGCVRDVIEKTLKIQGKWR
jgi:3-deoxy-D-manno-octulosonate 8-phosphate phosphatase (KDO 8-P phosphatase)